MNYNNSPFEEPEIKIEYIDVKSSKTKNIDAETGSSQKHLNLLSGLRKSITKTAYLIEAVSKHYEDEIPKTLGIKIMKNSNQSDPDPISDEVNDEKVEIDWAQSPIPNSQSPNFIFLN